MSQGDGMGESRKMTWEFVPGIGRVYSWTTDSGYMYHGFIGIPGDSRQVPAAIESPTCVDCESGATHICQMCGENKCYAHMVQGISTCKKCWES
jgi:hypothetical protein